MLEDEHPHAPSLRKLVNSKFVKSQSYRRQDMSNAPPKDVLRLSKKVGMVKRGTSEEQGWERDAEHLEGILPSFPGGEMSGEGCLGMLNWAPHCSQPLSFPDRRD